MPVGAHVHQVLPPFGLERVAHQPDLRRRCAGGRGEVVVVPGVVADGEGQFLDVVVAVGVENVLALLGLERVPGGKDRGNRGERGGRRRAGGQGEVVIGPGMVADRDRQFVQVIVVAAKKMCWRFSPSKA